MSDLSSLISPSAYTMSTESQSQPADLSPVFTHTSAAGRTYYLNRRETKSAAGKVTYFYYFSKERKDSAIASMPDGYSVQETNGMPTLKRDVHFIPTNPTDV